MKCPYCSAALSEGTAICSHCGGVIGAAVSLDQTLHNAAGPESAVVYGDMPEFGVADGYEQIDYIPVEIPRNAGQAQTQKKRNKPHILLRIPLQILSFILSIVLMVSLLATALVLDLNRVLSAGGIKQVMEALFSVSESKTPQVPVGAVGVGVLRDEMQMDVDNVEIPADVLTSGDTEALVEWLASMIEEAAGTEVELDEQQLQEFVEQSTLTDYMAEKAAGYAEDFINGTQNTQITPEELLQLMEENEELIASTFQVELTPQVKADLEVVLEQTIEENNLNELIHQEVFTSMQDAITESLPVQWEQLQAILKLPTSDTVVLALIGVCVVLMLLLCALNFYNIPGGLAWSAVPCILAGVLL